MQYNKSNKEDITITYVINGLGSVLRLTDRNLSVFIDHTGQCKRTGGCYNELVVAFFSTGGGVKGKKIYTC